MRHAARGRRFDGIPAQRAAQVRIVARCAAILGLRGRQSFQFEQLHTAMPEDGAIIGVLMLTTLDAVQHDRLSVRGLNLIDMRGRLCKRRRDRGEAQDGRAQNVGFHRVSFC